MQHGSVGRVGTGHPAGAVQVGHHERAEDHLIADAAIDVQFVELLAVDFHLDPHGWEHAGDRARRENDAAIEFGGFARAARSDRPHIPHDEPLGIQVRGADVQAATGRVRDGHFRQNLIRDFFRDSFRQRSRIVHGVRERNVKRRSRLKDVLAADVRHVDLQQIVVMRPEEGEGRDDAASADAGDDIELRAGSRVGPSFEHADAEGPVHTAAGEREELIRPRAGRVAGRDPAAKLRFHFPRDSRFHRRVRVRRGPEIDEVSIRRNRFGNAVPAGAAGGCEHRDQQQHDEAKSHPQPPSEFRRHPIRCRRCRPRRTSDTRRIRRHRLPDGSRFVRRNRRTNR